MKCNLLSLDWRGQAEVSAECGGNVFTALRVSLSLRTLLAAPVTSFTAARHTVSSIHNLSNSTPSNYK